MVSHLFFSGIHQKFTHIARNRDEYQAGVVWQLDRNLDNLFGFRSQLEV